MNGTQEVIIIQAEFLKLIFLMTKLRRDFYNIRLVSLK